MDSPTALDRLQHLGRRALEEPPTLAIPPRSRQAADCHKPVSTVRYRVERHEWGAGRLPILTAPDDVCSERDAQAAMLCGARARAAARAAAKARAATAAVAQVLAQQQAVRARVTVAKEFSAQVDRRNAEWLRKAAGSRVQPDEQQQQQQRGPGTPSPAAKLPMVERHLQLAVRIALPTAPTPLAPAAAAQGAAAGCPTADTEGGAPASPTHAPDAAQPPAGEEAGASDGPQGCHNQAPGGTPAATTGAAVAAATVAPSEPPGASDEDAPATASAAAPAGAAKPASGPLAAACSTPQLQQQQQQQQLGDVHHHQQWRLQAARRPGPPAAAAHRGGAQRQPAGRAPPADGADALAARWAAMGELGAALARLYPQVCAGELRLPPLCSCGHGASPLDPAYPESCCANCQLRARPGAWQRLVASVVGSMGKAARLQATALQPASAAAAAAAAAASATAAAGSRR